MAFSLIKKVRGIIIYIGANTWCLMTASRFFLFFRRVIYAAKGVILGQWKAEWSHTWDDLKEKPKQRDKKVEFLLKVW